jgi:hypothetical protein
MMEEYNQQLTNIHAELCGVNANLQKLIEILYEQNQIIQNLNYNERLFK